MDETIFYQYKDELECIILKDKAAQRIRQVGRWPNTETDAGQDEKLDAVSELLVFNECVKRPFFRILYHSLHHNIRNLSKYVKSMFVPITSKMLTYEEAYEFFSALYAKQYRTILEEYAPDSATFNSFLKSIKDGDIALFEATLNKKDFTDLLSWAYTLRELLFGVSGKTQNRKLKRGTNLWLDGLDYSQYFVNYLDGYEALFVEKEIKKYAGTYCKAFPYGEQVPDKLYKKIAETSLISDGGYYPVWLNRLKDMLSQNIDLVEYFESLSKNHRIESRCEEAVFYFLGESATNNINRINAEFAIDSKRERISTKETERIWDSILIKDDEDELSNFGLYIIKHTIRMLNTYIMVNGILPHSDMEVLGWLLKCSSYSNIIAQSRQMDPDFKAIEKRLDTGGELVSETDKKENKNESDSPTKEVNSSNALHIKQKLFRRSEIETFCELLAKERWQNTYRYGIKYIDSGDIKCLLYFFTGVIEGEMNLQGTIWWKGSTASLIYIVKQLLSMERGEHPKSCPNGTWKAVSSVFVFGDDNPNTVTRKTLAGYSNEKIKAILAESMVSDNLTELQYIDSLFDQNKWPIHTAKPTT